MKKNKIKSPALAQSSDSITELYRIYRPTTLEEVRGQDKAVSVLRTTVESGRVPHCILFSGPSGTGKTTLARILAKHLKCSDSDMSEINCADFKGIDMVRDIRSRMVLRPLGGKVRVWIIDEAHKLTNDAQNALLKILEDTPKHAFFMLATTEPKKLLPTIRTRCTEIVLGCVGDVGLSEIVSDLSEKAGFKLNEEVSEKIVELAEGSGRKAAVLLNQILGIKGTEEQLNALESTLANEKAAIDLAKYLMFTPKLQWNDTSKLLKAITDDPETVRRCILGYANTVCLSGNRQAPRAYALIVAFGANYFDTGKAGLTASCWEIVNP